MSKLPETNTKAKTIAINYFAADREMLADIVALLGCLKTSLALIVAGALLVESTDNPFAHFAGWGFMALGGWLAVRKENQFKELRNRL